MSFIESDRMSGVSGSIIRELFKMTAAPDMISFAGGNPSPDTFPMEEMAAIANDALLHRGASMLQYGFTEGFPPAKLIISGAAVSLNSSRMMDPDTLRMRSDSMKDIL